HDVEAPKPGVQHPVAAERQGIGIKGVRKLTVLELLRSIEIGIERSEHFGQPGQISWLGVRDDVDVLRPSNEPVKADCDPTDDQKLDAFPDEGLEDSLYIEVRHRAGDVRP